MADPWRLLITPPAPGAWNMAVDEVLLEMCARGESLPTLRLYSWEPPCLSLGYAQPLSDVDIARLESRGWDLVRRLTGGRAVLHTDELTYSVIAPPDEALLAGGVLPSYNRLARALVGGLRRLGLPVEVQEQPATQENQNPNPVCFEVPSTYEITAGGKKLIGSAQARRKDGVLQHGSLPLTGDLSRIIACLAFPDEDARARAAIRLLERATTVESIMGQPVAWEQAANAFQAAFEEILSLDLQTEDLTSRERDRAGELAAKKYTHPDWTCRGSKGNQPPGG